MSTPAVGLWEFANRFYARPQIGDCCLQLQDESDVDVCVLLLLMWLASRGRAVRPTQVQMILRVSEEWRAEVVQPLRILRRRLKAGPTFVQDSTREALRLAIKSAELQAERLQLEALEATFRAGRLCDEVANPWVAAVTSLESYQSALSRIFPAAAIEALLGGIEARIA